MFPEVFLVLGGFQVQ